MERNIVTSIIAASVNGLTLSGGHREPESEWQKSRYSGSLFALQHCSSDILDFTMLDPTALELQRESCNYPIVIRMIRIYLSTYIERIIESYY